VSVGIEDIRPADVLVRKLVDIFGLDALTVISILANHNVLN
jgi:hypothetical protein